MKQRCSAVIASGTSTRVYKTLVTHFKETGAAIYLGESANVEEGSFTTDGWKINLE